MNKDDNMSTKLDSNQQEYLKEVNTQYKLNLSNDFICNECTLKDYLNLLKIITEIDEEKCQKCEKIHDSSSYMEPSYRIRPIDSQGKVKN